MPHTEVDLILVNGEPMDFSYLVREDDRISVYPFFESLDITSLVRVRPPPLSEPRFVLDTHLGRLAAYLRMLGFDTLFRNDYADEELALLSSREHRILLTRDAGLLKRSVVTHGWWVRETNARRQVIQVLAAFRSIHCNCAIPAVPPLQWFAAARPQRGHPRPTAAADEAPL